MNNPPISDMDYVEFYAERLKIDNRLFKQQKLLIDSQIIASRSLFRNKFKEKDFKTEARRYLKDLKII